MDSLLVTRPDVGGHGRAEALAVAAPRAGTTVPLTVLVETLDAYDVVAVVEGRAADDLAGVHGPVLALRAGGARGRGVAGHRASLLRTPGVGEGRRSRLDLTAAGEEVVIGDAVVVAAETAGAAAESWVDTEVDAH